MGGEFGGAREMSLMTSGLRAKRAPMWKTTPLNLAPVGPGQCRLRELAVLSVLGESISQAPRLPPLGLASPDAGPTNTTRGISMTAPLAWATGHPMSRPSLDIPLPHP